ncbi:hypothetical protein [Microbulbifer epialgicus]|uniref:Minor tail protein n=1 Tax=Microbulbifer epialgicus TaxID=393907 RepID=A0ABV4P6E7_9GAMM
MPIEDANYISELDSNNPAHGDPAGWGDDHLRMMKKALKNSLPNISGKVDLTHDEINGLPQSILDAVSATVNFMLPHTEQKYSIKPWSTILAPVPDGWQLMDGTNGIPDLRGLFVVGAGNGYSVGDSGGSVDRETEEAGEHDHDGKTGGTAITKAQMPPHGHGVAGQKVLAYPGNESSTFGPDYDPSDKDGKVIELQSEGDGEKHDHTVGSDGKHKHTVDVRPPYYALAWIIKTSEITSSDITDLLAGLSGEDVE